MFIRYNLLGIFWALFILILTGVPGSDLPKFDFWDFLALDKIAHIFLFAVLSLFLIVGFTKQHSFNYLKYHPKVSSLSFGIFYGGFTEILQGLIFKERSADVFDFLANVIGCFFGLFIFNTIYRKL